MPDSDDILVSYFDVDVYKRHLKLFQQGQWLNDTCINFCFQRILQNEFANVSIDSDIYDVKESVLLLDPSLVSFIRLQCDDQEEYEDLRISLEIDKKAWIIIPINDNESFQTSSSHWSTLLCHVASRKLWYYDSLRHNPNLPSAKHFMRKFSHVIKWDFNIHDAEYDLTVLSSGPVQTNGYDCGVYTILFAQHVISLLKIRKLPLLLPNHQPDPKYEAVVNTNIQNILFETIHNAISPAAAIELRTVTAQDIQLLAAEYKPHNSNKSTH